VVAGVTGMQMQETVPDHVFDSPMKIELVDLEPDELLQRLRDGRSMCPAQRAPCAGKFLSARAI